MNPNLIPPTPTLLPQVTAQIVLQSSRYRIWSYTDEAIMLWQMATPARTQVFQIGILVVLIIIFAFMAIRWIQSLSEA